MKLNYDIHNYYEHLILEQIAELGLTTIKNTNYLADLCCLALNQLPPRYIRYEVDMSFYLPLAERQQMDLNVTKAIQTGIAYLDNQVENKK